MEATGAFADKILSLEFHICDSVELSKKFASASESEWKPVFICLGILVFNTKI